MAYYKCNQSCKAHAGFAVIENYSKALDLLDDYDHQSLSRPVRIENMLVEVEGLGVQ